LWREPASSESEREEGASTTMSFMRRSRQQADASEPAEAGGSALTPEQRHVMLQKGTERPHSGEYATHFDDGVYKCIACDTPLFGSDTKFESTTPGLVGWPAFSGTLEGANVELREDRSHGMRRTEVLCKACGGHLGHLFDDPDAPNRTHYCVNSVCLRFEPEP
jgi:peptide-methionine (R)-S-oxide reductase